jgi:hypothetical protein
MLFKLLDRVDFLFSKPEFVSAAAHCHDICTNNDSVGCDA